MTDRLYKAIELAERENEHSEISYDEGLILDWLDDKVDVINKVEELYKASPATLNMVEFDESGEKHAVDIETCAWMSEAKREVFIFSGIAKLAKIAGQELFERPYCKREDGSYEEKCYYFFYKEVQFFQLCGYDENLR